MLRATLKMVSNTKIKRTHAAKNINLTIDPNSHRPPNLSNAETRQGPSKRPPQDHRPANVIGRGPNPLEGPPRATPASAAQSTGRWPCGAAAPAAPRPTVGGGEHPRRQNGDVCGTPYAPVIYPPAKMAILPLWTFVPTEKCNQKRSHLPGV